MATKGAGGDRRSEGVNGAGEMRILALPPKRANKSGG